MLASFRRVLFFCICLSFMLLSSSANAAEIIVDTSTGGGFVAGYYGHYDPNRDMPPGSYPPTIGPDLDPNAQVYFLGRTTSSPLDTGFTTPERRVAFMFDMAGIAASIPSGEVIDEVAIKLELLPGGSSLLANFEGGAEAVVFTSTPFFAGEILDPNTVPPPPDPNLPGPIDMIWGSFGEGDFYGEFVVPDPIIEPTATGPHEIPLTEAIPDLETAIIFDDIFIVTARLETFDPGPIGAGAPPAITPYEYIFGGTDVGTAVPFPELIITTKPIPEPATWGLFGLAMVCMPLRRHKL